jgi:hypothetical protein
MNKVAVFHEVALTYIDEVMYVVISMVVFHNRVQVAEYGFAYDASIPDDVVADQVCSGYDVDSWRWQHSFHLPNIPMLGKSAVIYSRRDLMGPD